MIKKEVFTGLFLGLIANVIGICVVTLVLALYESTSFLKVIELYSANDNLWMLICLGATFNLAIFYYFLNQKKWYRARGVLSATFIAAITSYIIYFL